MSLSPTSDPVSAFRAQFSDSAACHSRLDNRVYNLLLLATQALAFWPLWEWYAGRIIHFPENRAGLAALLTAIVLSVVARQSDVRRAGLRVPLACLLVYFVTQPFVHPLVGCIPAAICIGYTATHFVSVKRRAPVIGLLLLALPVIPSMQTYIGYPLRLLIAELAAPVARMGGTLETVREGVGLRWSGGLVLVDEPCSGVRMLWTGYFMAFTMTGILGLSLLRTLALCFFTLGMVMAGNLLRSVALFTAEVRAGGALDDNAHGMVGLFCFALAGMGIIWFASRLSQKESTR